jgi:fibronectin-binding autotransporter adhesin
MRQFSVNHINYSRPAIRNSSTLFPKAFAIAALSASILGASASAQRTTTFWNTATGDFSSSQNWTSGTPTNTRDAKVDNAGIARITAPFTQPVVYVFLGSIANTSGTLEISGGGSGDFTSMIVGGRNGTGTLMVSGGGTLSSYGGSLASDIGSVGIATVDGAGSSWSVTGPEMRIGNIGNGIATIQNGGTLTVGPNGSGKITLAGESVAEGSLNIGNGTLVGAVRAGENAAGNG